MSDNLEIIPETMTTLEIAVLTGKRHGDIMRDVRVMKQQYFEFKDSAQICAMFQDADYKDKSGKTNPMIKLSKEASLDLVTGYNLKARNTINNRWQELESKVLAQKTWRETRSLTKASYKQMCDVILERNNLDGIETEYWHYTENAQLINFVMGLPTMSYPC